jgi:hypothetical protein
MEAFKKTFRPRCEVALKLAPGTPIEVWCQDEMRVGQKNKLTYRWAKKAHSTYLFGAICPELGTGAALVLPACNSEAMQLISMRSRPRSAPEHTQSSYSIKPAGMAPNSHGAEQNHVNAAAAARARTQRSRKHLAVHAAELALKSDLQILRRYRRSLLLRVEHPHRSALENHVHRAPRLQPWLHNVSIGITTSPPYSSWPGGCAGRCAPPRKQSF